MPDPPAFTPILAALHTRVRFEASYAKEESPTRLRILGRLAKDATSAHKVAWKRAIFGLLEDAEGWSVDISYHCFRKTEPVPDVVQIPRLIFQSRSNEPLSKYYPEIARRLSVVVVPDTGSIQVHVQAHRNDPAANNGRGAQLSGQAIVGPAAFQRQKLGG